MPQKTQLSARFWNWYDQLAPRITAFVYARLGGKLAADADDLCQEIWMRVHTKCPPDIADNEFPAWLFTVARHVVYDHHKKKRTTTLPDEQQPGAENDPADLLMAAEEAKQRRQWLADCIASLDDLRRSVLRGWLACMSMADICQPLDISADRGYKLNHEAKKQVEECVQYRREGAGR